jgi:hypothetical protein
MAQSNVTDAELAAAVQAFREAADGLASIGDRIGRMKCDDLATIREAQVSLNASLREASALVGKLFIQQAMQEQNAELARLRQG